MRLTPAYLIRWPRFYDMFEPRPKGAHRRLRVHEHLVLAVRRGRDLRRDAGGRRRRPALQRARVRVPGRVRDRADGLGRRRVRRARSTPRTAARSSRTSRPGAPVLRDKQLRRRTGAVRALGAGLMSSTRRPLQGHRRARASTRSTSTSAAAATRCCARRCEMEPGRRARGDAGLQRARARRRRLRDGPEDVLHPQGDDGQVPRLQRRRVRAGDVQGPRADAEEPASADRGDHHRRLRDRREPRSSSSAASTPTRPTSSTRRVAEATPPASSASASSAPTTRSTWSCTAAPAPTSAARRPALLDSLEGKRGNPRLKPPFPAVQGLYQGPTLINNVETLMNVPIILRMGGEQYAEIGTETSTGTKVVSVSGQVQRPGQLRDRARHAGRATSSTTWPAARSRAAVQGVVPRRLQRAGAAADRRGARPALRLRLAGQGGVDARLGRDHRVRRLDLDRRRGLQDRALLPPRVLRQVLAVPRGHELDGEDARCGSRTATRRRWTSTSWRRSASRSWATACACWATRWRCPSGR